MKFCSSATQINSQSAIVSGTTWDLLGFESFQVYVIFIDDKDNIIVSTSNGTFRSTDKGIKWSVYEYGIKDHAAFRTIIPSKSGYLYGGSNKGIYRTVKKVLSVRKIEEEPFFLSQNYPNPFNSLTRVKFAVPHSAKVNISVYDVLGRYIKTVMDEERAEGTHEILVYVEELTSGIYFLKLTTGIYSVTKKNNAFKVISIIF